MERGDCPRRVALFLGQAVILEVPNRPARQLEDPSYGHAWRAGTVREMDSRRDIAARTASDRSVREGEDRLVDNLVRQRRDERRAQEPLPPRCVPANPRQ